MKNILFFIFFILSFFIMSPALAITFNKENIQLKKDTLFITSCVSPYDVVYWYDEPSHMMLAQNECDVNRVVIDSNGYNSVTGQPSYVGQKMSAEEDTTHAYFSVLSFIIKTPENSLDDMFATAGKLFNDLWVIISVAIGVPLAFYIINRAVGIRV